MEFNLRQVKIYLPCGMWMSITTWCWVIDVLEVIARAKYVGKVCIIYWWSVRIIRTVTSSMKCIYLFIHLHICVFYFCSGNQQKFITDPLRIEMSICKFNISKVMIFSELNLYDTNCLKTIHENISYILIRNFLHLVLRYHGYELFSSRKCIFFGYISYLWV